MPTLTQTWYENAAAAAARNASLKPASDTYKPPAYDFNPVDVGGDVAKYYATVLGAQPGYENILRNISGELAPDVRRQIAQAAAERGVGIGSYGGANDASALLRALGLTSQELSNTGLEQYLKAYGTAPALNPANLFVSPTAREQMYLQWEMQQRELAAQAARQREALASQEKLARMGQGTALTTAAWNINAQERWADINRQAAEAWRGSIGNRLSALEAGLGGAGTTPVEYGTRPEEPVAGPPDWWYQGASERPGSGSMFTITAPRGELPTPQQEADILWGRATPEQYGYSPGYYNLSPDAAYQQFEQDFWGE